MVLSPWQKRGIRDLLNDNGLEFTSSFFTYTSGEIGPYFVFSERIMRNAIHYTDAVKDVANLVREHVPENSVISGGESRDFIFSNPVAIQLVCPACMIYKDGRIIGVDVGDKNVAHVADLNNEGSSVRDYWVPSIRKAGGNIGHVFFYVDRYEADPKIFRDLDVQTHSFLPLNEEMWQYLMETGAVTMETYNNARRRLEDKSRWANEMFRSEKGKDRLAELAGKNEKELKKVRKVLDVGYPDLREELVAGLKQRGIELSA